MARRTRKPLPAKAAPAAAARRPRRPGPAAPRADAPDPLAGLLRIDSSDSVLRVLADFDFDPSHVDLDALQGRIEAATAGPPAEDRPLSHEAYISGILAELMSEGEPDPPDGMADIPRDPPAPGDQTRRALEVGLARGRHFLVATDPILDLTRRAGDWRRQMRQGRAILAYAEAIPTPSTPGRAHDPVEDALLAAGRGLAAAMVLRFPAELDIPAPHLPAVPGPVARRTALWTADGHRGLRRAHARMAEAVSLRTDLIEAARSSWELGSALLDQLDRIAAGTAPDGKPN